MPLMRHEIDSEGRTVVIDCSDVVARRQRFVARREARLLRTAERLWDRSSRVIDSGSAAILEQLGDELVSSYAEPEVVASPAVARLLSAIEQLLRKQGRQSLGPLLRAMAAARQHVAQRAAASAERRLDLRVLRRAIVELVPAAALFEADGRQRGATPCGDRGLVSQLQRVLCIAPNAPPYLI